MSANNCLRICMWSGPRNVSTALMYSFAQRQDTRVFDEPLYGHYLQISGVKHPGAEEIMTVMDCDGERVLDKVVLGPCEKPALFFKMMAHHLVGIDWGFLEQTTNVLLIRDPQEMLPSLAKNLPNPTLQDTGYDIQVTLLKKATAQGRHPVVLDARELLLNPPGVLRQLCQRLNILFDEAMLRWPAGPRPEDGIWAKFWYDNVHKSTGFNKYRPKTTPFPEQLRPLLEECQSYYKQLSTYVLKAGVEEEP